MTSRTIRQRRFAQERNWNPSIMVLLVLTLTTTTTTLTKTTITASALKIRDSHIRDNSSNTAADETTTTKRKDKQKQKKKPPSLLFVQSILYNNIDPLATNVVMDESHKKNPITAAQEQLKQYTVDLMYNSFHDNFILRPPRDLWEGLLDAVSNIGRGWWGALCGVADAGWDGYSVAGLPGLLGGGMVGLASGLALATGGMAAGLYQLLQGVSNTPMAIQESGHGKTWNHCDGHWFYYSMDVEDKQIDQDLALTFPEESRRRSNRHLRQRSRRRVKDKEFYQILKVPTDASPSEIKRAYYREALLTHPDKNVEDAKANERFQHLSLAYRTLSNDDTREAYDQMGKCFVEPQTNQQLDSYTFFAVMFGSYLVEPYVGELKIASLVDSFLQVTETSRLHEHHHRAYDGGGGDDVDQASLLKQKRRALDIALHLRDRLAKYNAGSQSEAEFRASCRLEAMSIAKGDFGDSFLISIGRSLTAEGKKFIGKHTSVLGLHGATASLQATTFDMMESYQTLVALFQSVVSSVGPLVEAYIADAKRQNERPTSDSSANSYNGGGGTAGGGNCGSDHEANIETVLLMNKLERSIPRALRLVWQLNDRDIRQTLKEAVDRLLRDGSSYDVRLARAQGLVILGSEFHQMGVLQKRKDRWEDIDALKRSMRTAFEAAMTADMQHAGFYE